MTEKQVRREMFRFYPNKITKIPPSGNIRNGTKCPKARSGHRIVVDESNIYSFGGYNPTMEIDDNELQSNDDWLISCPLFRELWKFNLVSKTWVKLKTTGYMPEELASHATILLEDKLIVFGGTGVPFGASSSNRVHVCDLKKLEWCQIQTTGIEPIEQYGQAMALHQGCLYILGGTTGFEYSMDVHELNLKTKVWKQLIPTTKEKPAERYRHEIAIEDGKIYVLGGGTALVSFGLKKVSVFEIAKQEWKKMKTYPDLSVQEGYPLARKCHGSVKAGPFVYICGGHDGATVFPDIWRLNLHTMQWTKLPQSLPKPVYFHSTGLSPSGQMFVFGGVISVGENKRTSSLYSVFLTIPPLKELAWLAVQHYAPNLPCVPKQELLEQGVPLSLLDRVAFETTKAVALQDPQAAMP